MNAKSDSDKSGSANSMQMRFFISTQGNDRWSGRLARPNRDKTDGPWATPGVALARLAQLKTEGQLTGPVTVEVKDGVYELDKPLLVSPEQSWPVTFVAAPGETPVFSGGKRITKWNIRQLNGRTVWVADLPEVREDKWLFRSLFVNGRRAERPRLPKQGLFRMASVPGLKLPSGWGNGGQTAFISAPGDVKQFSNLADVEVVCLHFWIEERSEIAGFDPETNRVEMSRPSYSALVGSHGSQLADYYLDNVREALTEPGQWYLDRHEGRLYYLPMKGELPKSSQVIAPRLLQLLAVEGDPENSAYVEHLRFHGIAFAHTDWRHPSADGADIRGHSRHSRMGRGNRAAAGQAANDVPGVIALEGARHCTLENCTLEHIGWYGVSILDGCSNIRVIGCMITDAGAGGIKADGEPARQGAVESRRTSDLVITDNTIRTCGRIFHSACGVLSMNACRVTIAHNHIHNLFYTGVSCGWVWGYRQNASHSNTIAFNHIHDIGQGLLSDMGGIYTLGIQPVTVIRNNLIHDINSAHYGGWCIYPDEGSSHLLIENNVCYNADRQAFNQHYGRENMVINNIFAFGGDAAASIGRKEDHVGVTFVRNLFISDGVPMFSPGYSYEVSPAVWRGYSNLFYDVSGKQPTLNLDRQTNVTLDKWQAMGLDQSSVWSDPGCRNLKRRDFTLKANSPALALGFEPIDLTMVGPRPANR